MDRDFAKVLLYAYPKLPQLAEAVSVGAMNKAMLSFRCREGALEAAERVAKEIFIKIGLEEVYGALTEILGSLGEEENFLLEYKYFRRKKLLKGYTGVFPASERSYFRRQNALLDKICFRLGLCGWTEKRFSETFGGFPPFMRLYRAIKEGRERLLSAKRERRGIVFQNSVCSSGGSEAFLPRRTNRAMTTAAAQDAQITPISNAESLPPEGSAGVSCSTEGALKSVFSS